MTGGKIIFGMIVRVPRIPGTESMQTTNICMFINIMGMKQGTTSLALIISEKALTLITSITTLKEAVIIITIFTMSIKTSTSMGAERIQVLCRKLMKILDTAARKKKGD